jgi:putative ABC transport system substrate-binding protein
MQRREFITLLGGTVAWPLSVRAQQLDRVRHIGMLVAFDDPDIKAFQQELERLGWSEGRNIHIEYRYAPAGAQVQALAKELVALQPEVIFTQSRPVIAALQQETTTIPIVFTFVTDPIGAGFIDRHFAGTSCGPILVGIRFEPWKRPTSSHCCGAPG